MYAATAEEREARGGQWSVPVGCYPAGVSHLVGFRVVVARARTKVLHPECCILISASRVHMIRWA